MLPEQLLFTFLLDAQQTLCALLKLTRGELNF